ncbi:uncharacterized protein [Ptychodera flava]|uniref:uncharacterized protein n=1 Tax=Ptychodera flava TaxID=63121 RepID=UPI00396A3451
MQFFVTVNVISCTQLSPPSNAYKSCDADNLYGSTCTFNCLAGYYLSGSSTKTCGRTGSWSGSSASCHRRTCQPPLKNIEHGSVSCTDSNYQYSVCLYTCENGYTVSTISSIVCSGPSGTSSSPSAQWSGSPPTCIDVEPPQFSFCPDSQKIYASEGSSEVTVTWDQPIADDNSLENVSVVLSEGSPPASTFDQGYHIIKYTATDSAGNTGTCLFSILVKVVTCTVLPHVPKLWLSCPHGYILGSVCSFDCDEGYELFGLSNTKCNATGDPPKGIWTNNPPVCEPVTCPELMPPVNGHVMDGTVCGNSYNDLCYFECNVGYHLVGSNARRCTATKVWDGIEAVCQVETCPRPQLYPGTEMVNSSNCAPSSNFLPHGSVCEFVCDQGSYLDGAMSISCGADGYWEQLIPMCLAVTCDAQDLPDPINGYKSCSGTVAYGYVCSLSCNYGYLPSTSIQRMCIDNGQGSGVWDNGTITCEIVTCDPLEPPMDGFVGSCNGGITDVEDRQSYSSVCLTECNDGYTGSGSYSRTCLAAGHWDGIPLKCEDVTDPEIYCPSDNTVYAGEGMISAAVPYADWEPIMASDRGINFPATFSGYDSTQVNVSKPSTLSEGTHSLLYKAVDTAGNTVTCTFEVEIKVTRCRGFYTPQHGVVNLVRGHGNCEDNVVFGSECEIQCNPGYNLSTGASIHVRKCEQSSYTSEDGTWSNSLPQCQPLTCDVPAVENGYASGCPTATVEFTTVCDFYCDEGYMTGTGMTSIERQCSADQSWTGDDFQCDVQVTCPGPHHIENGNVTPLKCQTESWLPFETVCYLSCNAGYQQSGPFSKQCTASGRWNDVRETTCKDVESPRFEIPCPQYITANADHGMTSTVITFSEPAANDNSGNLTVERQSGHKGPGDRFNEGFTTILYSATDAAGNFAVCSVIVQVQVTRCPSIQAPISGGIQCNGYMVGAACSFTCNDGYVLEGSESRTCELAAGTDVAYWNGTQTRCDVVTCPSLATPINAIKSGCSASVPGSENFGTVCTFYCEHGYQGIGDSQKQCLADGTWTSTEFSCVETTCPSIVLPSGMDVLPSQCMINPAYRDICSFSCTQNGFVVKPVDGQVVFCLANGQWSSDISTISCVDEEDPTFSSCPDDVIAYANRSSTSTNVEFDVAAEDNDGHVSAVSCNYQSGSVFQAGEYFVSCTAIDLAGNENTCSFRLSVIIRRCSALFLPAYGRTVSICDNAYGSSCTIECQDGYTLTGSDTFTCEYDGGLVYWQTDIQPLCEVNTCQALTLDQSVQVYPIFCAGPLNPSRGTSCTFYCPNGFTLTGSDTSPVTCLNNGEWNRNISTSITCQDLQAPTVSSCPGPIYATITDVTGVQVNFNEPTAVDNSGVDLSITKSPADITSPYTVTASTTVLYSFCDNYNNCVNCTFDIHVTDDIEPIVQHCPSDQTFEIEGNSNNITWQEPVFEEPTGDDLLITNNYNDLPYAELPIGTHTIVYLAENVDNGNTVSCQFNIEVTGKTCPALRPPENGAVGCSELIYGLTCTVFCNENFNVPRIDNQKIPQQYVCTTSGTWSHDYVPDCSNTRDAGRTFLSSDLQYYTNQCPTAEAELYIKEKFLELLMSSGFQDACTTTDDCTVEGVEVFCGSTTRRRKRASSYILSEMLTIRLKRKQQIIQKDLNRQGEIPILKRNKRSDLQFTLTITFKFEKNIINNPDQDMIYDVFDAEDAMIQMLDNVQDAIDGGNFQLQAFEDYEFQLKSDSLNYDNFAEINCDSPYMADNIDYVCVMCMKGTYYLNVTQKCVFCDKGFYQDEAGQTVCKKCPDGFTTIEDGSRNETECLKECTAGSYSETGVGVCSLCPIGYFQPEHGQTTCTQCPDGTTTSALGSTDGQQCREPCMPGSFSPDGLAPCTLCPRRYYQPNHGKRRCLLCPGINTTIGEGMTSVNQCIDVNECDSNPCQNDGTCTDMIDSYGCKCKDGFTDRNCETDIVDCEPHSCLNGGTCIDLINSYSCQCMFGFTGNDCSEDIDLCSPTPCMNGGVCTDLVNSYNCTCQPGYHGSNCEYKTNYCTSESCLNDANCTSHVDGYSCTCASGFTGLHCENNINDCKQHPCLHGSSCVDAIDSYSCVCSPGFTGHNCEERIVLCAASPCQNNGTCLDFGHNISCLCPFGKGGPLCERDIHPESTDNPCKNGGMILFEDNSFTCTCRVGYVGQYCEQNFNDCGSSPCSNDGTCIDREASYECICQLGFTGSNCEEEIDECLSRPCFGDSTCIDEINGYTCLCSEDFKGLNCDEIDHRCDATLCQNGGVCVMKDNGTAACECGPGFAGFTCSINIDECLSKPCKHGSLCMDAIDGFTCQCVDGYTGHTCEVDINECASDPCLHGKCQDGLNQFSCICNDGFIGTACEDAIDYCVDDPCKNGGTCESSSGAFNCSCVPGFGGPGCVVNINECASYPCVNAESCTDGVNDYMCQCLPGWSGKRCNNNIDDCALSPCQNNGDCVDLVDGFSCYCKAGFSGNVCQDNIDDCLANHCQNGAECIDGISTYTCQCPTGFTGKYCQIAVNNCHPNPCFNGGVCEVLNDGYLCTCLEGFEGDTCEVNTDDCLNHLCQNGASCIDKVNQYKCRCSSGFTGVYCDVEINECDSSPCQNGASCYDLLDSFKCICTPGYTGLQCEEDIDHCVPNRCINGGLCVDGVNEFECNCPSGYGGTICDVDINECSSNPCKNSGLCTDGVNGYYCTCVPGFTGQDCAQALPSNYDLHFSSSTIHPSGHIEIDISHSRNITGITLLFWILTDTTGSIFTLSSEYFREGNSLMSVDVTGDEIHMSIYGETLQADVTVHDGKWHCFAITWKSATGQVEIYKDGHPEYNQYDFQTDVVLPEEGSLIVNLQTHQQEKASVDLSGYQLWDRAVSHEEIMDISESCHSNVPGNLVSWAALVDGLQGYGISIQSPSLCDDVDECASFPCMKGSTCLDLLHSYECHCPNEYSGQWCDIPVDFCSDNLCQNGATCQVDGYNYTCICQNGFTGNKCDIQTVNGGWSAWRSLSECSASCGGGIQHFTRTCDNPAPLNDGQDCYGNANETRTCNVFDCPACDDLVPPTNGHLHCNESGEEKECTVFCKSGYAFGEAPMDLYTCGRSSYWVWNHQHFDNPTARLPSCTEIQLGKAVHLSVIISYPSMPCTSDEHRIAEEIRALIQRHISDIYCLRTETCLILDTKVNSCGNKEDIKKLRMETNITEPYAELGLQNGLNNPNSNSTSGQSVHKREVLKRSIVRRDVSNPYFAAINYMTASMDDFRELFQLLSASGELTFNVNGVPVTPGDLGLSGWLECDGGMAEGEDGFCTPCGVGTYLTWLDGWPNPQCEPCPRNSYQDREGQEECIPCPDGLITNGYRTTSISECFQPPTQEADLTSSTISSSIEEEDGHGKLTIALASIAAAVFVIAMIIAFAVFVKVKANKSHQRVRQMRTSNARLLQDDNLDREEFKRVDEKRPPSVISTSAFGLHFPLDGKAYDLDGNVHPLTPPPPYSETEA